MPDPNGYPATNSDSDSPITAGEAAVGGAGIFSLANVLFSGRRKAQRELDDTANAAPKYAGSNPISNYYQSALARYGVNPTSSAMYTKQQQDINKNTATGLNTLGDKRSAIAGVGNVVQAADNSSLNANVQAENQQNQRFGQLQGATQMQNADDRFKFQTNTLDPYQLKLSIASLKAKAANDRYNAGIKGIGDTMNNAAMLASKAAFL